MNVTIRPSSAAGTAPAPPSKSMAHRLLLCAGQCPGETLVRGVAASQDILATLDCLSALGIDSLMRDGDVTLYGKSPRLPEPGTVLPCRESGSTLRFFLPLCLSGPPVTLTGSPRLLERPLGVYRDLCREKGIRFEQTETSVTVEGTLRPGEFTLPGDVSSQFVSGLLFALPALPGDSRIRLAAPVESRSYILLTMDALRRFGIETRWLDDGTVAVPGRQRFRLPARAGSRPAVTVEGDWSNAAFLLALGPGVTVTGLDPNSLQGDRVCETYFRALEVGRERLDLSDCPDLGPVLLAYAAARRGGTFTGTRRLRLKESDRGAVMAEELRKFGVPVTVSENEITVGSGLRPPDGALDGHNDHRIVMALSLLCARVGGTVNGAEAVDKSFPDFFERLRSLGIAVSFQGERGASAMN